MSLPPGSGSHRPAAVANGSRPSRLSSSSSMEAAQLRLLVAAPAMDGMEAEMLQRLTDPLAIMPVAATMAVVAGRRLHCHRCGSQTMQPFKTWQQSGRTPATTPSELACCAACCLLSGISALLMLGEPPAMPADPPRSTAAAQVAAGGLSLEPRAAPAQPGGVWQPRLPTEPAADHECHAGWARRVCAHADGCGR